MVLPCSSVLPKKAEKGWGLHCEELVVHPGPYQSRLSHLDPLGLVELIVFSGMSPGRTSGRMLLLEMRQASMLSRAKLVVSRLGRRF